MTTLQALVRLRGPERIAVPHIKAFVLGVGDGWRQPHELRTSTNVDHLGDVQESLDRGICWGQVLRSPRHHQRWWK